MLIDEVCNEVLPIAAGHHVADVRIGLGYTGVQLDDGRCGLAYTFRQQTGAGCAVMPEAGSLTGRSAGELAALVQCRDVIRAAVGLATLNALVRPQGYDTGDILNLLAVDQADVVGMVGYFGPLVDTLRKNSKALHIIEQREDMGANTLPVTSAETILPQCHVVIITATTLLNRTLDGLLSYCRSAREIAILGPSTPMLPRVFAPRGVTLLSGIEVIDPPQALRIVSEGGGTRQLGKSIRKVSVRTN